MKHRAIICGAGRIGVGRNWIETPYCYTHAGAYAALKDRVELVGVVDTDYEAGTWASIKWDVPWYPDLRGALSLLKPQIVSICTPPTDRQNIIDLCQEYGVSGIWCEKPFAATVSPHRIGGSMKVQVNYIRRFDRRHWYCVNSGDMAELWVWAKKDIHTVCHFSDLARYWGIPRERFHYFEMNGPNSYLITNRDDPEAGTRFFPLGGIPENSTFMVDALSNLLDAVEGKAELISPPESAIESEKWADEILKGIA